VTRPDQRDQCRHYVLEPSVLKRIPASAGCRSSARPSPHGARWRSLRLSDDAYWLDTGRPPLPAGQPGHPRREALASSLARCPPGQRRDLGERRAGARRAALWRLLDRRGRGDRRDGRRRALRHWPGFGGRGRRNGHGLDTPRGSRWPRSRRSRTRYSAPVRRSGSGARSTDLGARQRGHGGSAARSTRRGSRVMGASDRRHARGGR